MTFAQTRALVNDARFFEAGLVTLSDTTTARHLYLPDTLDPDFANLTADPDKPSRNIGTSRPRFGSAGRRRRPQPYLFGRMLTRLKLVINDGRHHTAIDELLFTPREAGQLLGIRRAKLYNLSRMAAGSQS